eukprot:14130483-Alexandrium_andersonii.AAC.1
MLSAEFPKPAQGAWAPATPDPRTEVEVPPADGTLEGRQARQTVEAVAPAPGSEGVASTLPGCL